VVDGKRQYNETAVLKGNQAKKSCWKKEGGKPAASPISEEVISFGPEELAFNMAAKTDSLVIIIEKVPDCPDSYLRLTLTKTN